MMDRSVAVADTELISRRDRRAHPGFGLTNRAFQAFAPRKGGGDGR